MTGMARHGRRHLPFVGEDANMDKIDTPITISVATVATALIPAGVYIVGTSASTIQINNAGTWVSAGTAGYVVSDGVNVRLNNATAAAVVTTLFPLTSK